MILQNLQDPARAIIERAIIKDNWSHNWLDVEHLFEFDQSAMTFKIINRMGLESHLENIPPDIFAFKLQYKKLQGDTNSKTYLEYTKSLLQLLLHGTTSLS